MLIINGNFRKKEFFNVTLDEVKEEVFKHNPNAEFIDEAIVEDYVLSLEM